MFKRINELLDMFTNGHIFKDKKDVADKFNELKKEINKLERKLNERD